MAGYTYTKGRRVDGEAEGKWYPAKIATVHKDGTYTLNWMGEHAGTFTKNVPAAKIRIRMTGRSVGLDDLKGKGIGGIYVLNVPKAVKNYYKIGRADDDIERRVGSYITAYPWDFYVVAIMVWDTVPDDSKRYVAIHAAEKEILNAFPHKVMNHPRMQSSEWVVLNNPAETKKLRETMEKVALKHKVRVSWFGESHEIKWPYAKPAGAG